MSLFKLESEKPDVSDLDNIGITDCDAVEDEDSGNITCSDISSSQEDSYEISMSLVSPISILKKPMHYENENSQDSKENKRVVFDAVDVYYFERAQGFSCVPNQGGSTLGMENIHWRREKLPLNTFQKKRKREKHSILFQLCLEGVLSLTAEQFSYLNHKTKLKPYSDFDSDNESLGIVRDLKDSKEDGEVSCSSSTNSLHSFSSDLNGTNQVYSIPGESDSDDDELESLRSIEDGYFLQPVSIKKRRSLLKRSGIPRIDSNEKLECQEIRDSRLMCGCTCEGVCLPETCLCALNGIPCQVDRTCFPCACTTPTHCQNEHGRIKFDPIRARTHYLHTRMRLEMEQTSSSMNSFPGFSKDDRTEVVVDNFRINKFQSLKRNRPLDYDQSDNDVHKKNCRSASSISSGSDDNDSEKRKNHQTLANFSSLEKEENEAFLASYNTTSSGGCRDCQNSRYVNVLIQELANQQRHMREAMSASSRSPIMNIQSNRVNECMNFNPNGYELVDQTFSSTPQMNYNCHIYNSFDDSSTSYSDNDWHVHPHASFGRPRQNEYYRSVNQENSITPSMQMCGETDMVNLEAKENSTAKPMIHEEKSGSSHSIAESISSTNVTVNQDYYAECQNEYISSPNASCSDLIEYNSFQRKVNENVSCFSDSHSINHPPSSSVVSSTTNQNQLSNKMNPHSFDIFKTDESSGMSYTQQLMEDFTTTNTQIADHIPFSTLESAETLDDERFRLLPMTNSIQCRLEPISCLLNAPNLASKSLSALSGPVHIVPSPTEDPNNNLLATPTSTVSA